MEGHCNDIISCLYSKSQLIDMQIKKGGDKEYYGRETRFTRGYHSIEKNKPSLNEVNNEI